MKSILKTKKFGSSSSLPRTPSKESVSSTTPRDNKDNGKEKDKDKKKRLSLATISSKSKSSSKNDKKNSSSTSLLSLSKSSSVSSITAVVTINYLTDDALRHFFSVFPVLERLSLRKICSRWRTLIYETISELVLPSKCTERMDDFSLSTIYDTLGELKYVSLPSATHFTLWGLHSLLNASNLQSLTVSHAPPGSLRVVAEALGPRLLKLEWNSKHHLDSDAIYLGMRCQNLLTLKLNLSCIGDDGLGYLRACTKLTSLTLDTDGLRSSILPKFSTAGLQFLLSVLHELQYLECPAHSSILNVITLNCPQLRHLRFDGMAYYYLPQGLPLWPSDPAFNDALVALTSTLNDSLRTLTIKHCNALSHEGWLGVARNCRYLSCVKEEFRVHHGGFLMNGASMMALAGFCQFLKVYVSGGANALVDDSIEMLTKSCPDLEQLWLGESPLLTDVAFAHLPQMENLKLISFPSRNTGISDGSVGFVVDSCPNLEEIHLKSLSFTEKALKHLLRCPTLKCIEFSGESKILMKDIESFLHDKKRKCPLQKLVLPKKHCEYWDHKKYPNLKVELK